MSLKKDDEVDQEALHRGMNPTVLECLQHCPFLMFSMILISSGGILVGFVMAALNGILVMPSFTKSMGADQLTATQWADLSSWMTSSLLLGAAVSSPLAAPLADNLGRKQSITIALLITFSGGCIQTGAIAQYMMIVGRLIVGIAIGLLSSIIPLYLAELSPKSVRGFIISTFQVMIAIGILLAFVVTLAFNDAAQKPNTKVTGNYWRYILGIQAVMPVGMVLSGLCLPESPRWLISVGERDRAKSILMKTRRSLQVGQRLDDLGENAIITNIDMEYDMMCRDDDSIDKSATSRWYDFAPLFDSSVILRTSIGVIINILGQLSGFNSIIYYSSLIFKDMAISADKTTAIIGVLNVSVTLLSVFVMDRLGRRILLICGSISMCCCLLLMGFIVLTSNPSTEPASAKAVAVFIALFIVSYAYSYGPIAWLYPAEIFPVQIRTKGVCLSTCAGWLTSFAVNQSVPIMILPGSAVYGLGGTFFFFAFWTFLMSPWALAHVCETANMTLEDINTIFQIKTFEQYLHFICKNLSYTFYFGKYSMTEYTNMASCKEPKETTMNATNSTEYSEADMKA